MNISIERNFGTKPCNNKNYYTVLLPYKSDKIRYNIYLTFSKMTIIYLNVDTFGLKVYITFSTSNAS